jgi:hypothetical protein
MAKMPDTLDKLLSVGSTPDWISPAMSMMQDLFNSPRHDFHIDLNAGWSVNGIKRLLKRHRVKMWGDMIMDEAIVFSVRRSQARRAQSILIRNRIPILSGYVE